MEEIKVSSKAIEKPLSKFDYIAFAVIGIMCYLSFQQGDIMHTAGSSFGFLQGHILDYYDWVAYEYDIWDSYMPSTYILFAIWNIPLKLLGIVTEPQATSPLPAIMWYKLLPTLFYLGSGILVYKIAKEIGMGNGKSKLCMYAFLTAPIGFFSQFMFGQYDSFTVFFILLGLLYYYKKNHKLFVLYFALAIPFKLWPLLFFVPLLLLREKNIWKIIGNMGLVVIPYVVEFVLFYSNDAFRECVIGFAPTGYVSSAGIDAGSATISYMILLWGFTCAYAYFREPEDEVKDTQWSLYLCCLVLVALFGLTQWHPQWLLLAMPFFVLTAFINKNTKLFLVLDIPMMLFFSAYVVNTWPRHVDQELFAWGIFGDYIYKYIGSKLMMKDIYMITDTTFLYTGFTVLLVISAVLKHPKLCVADFKENVNHCIGWIRARFFVGVGIFVIPAVVCFISAMLPPYLIYKTSDSYGITEPLMADSPISQVFVSPARELDRVIFRVATYERINDIDVDISVIDFDTNEVVHTMTVNASDFVDNGWITVSLKGVEVEPWEEYRLEFKCEEANAENCITFYRTEDYGKQPYGGAMRDGEWQGYHMCMEIYATEKNSD